MLQFLNTIFLWALPLIALPVLIHLFNRRRRQPIAWGAMRFLMQAATRRRRIWRLTDLLLLLLRMAIIALIVMALTQPRLRWDALSGHAPRDMIIVLDASLSTALRSGGEPVLARQIARVRKTLDQLDDNDYVRLMVAAGERQWLVPTARPVTQKTRREIDSLLDGVKPSSAGADLMMCLSEAVEAEPASPRTVRIVTLVTDGRAYGWHADTPSAWQNLPRSFHEQTGRGRVFVLRETPEGPAVNLALASLEAAHPTIGVGQAFDLSATVWNSADSPTPACLVSWTLDGQALGSSSVPALAPGGKTAVKIETSLPSKGLHKVQCRVELPDDLSLDNDEQVVLEAVDRVPVLVVDGQFQQRVLDSGAGYLLAAMGYLSGGQQGRAPSILSPHHVDILDLDAESLGRYHAVVLSDVGRLTKSQVIRLGEYVRQGGGLWVALGDRTYWEDFNRVMYADGQGLSPLPLEEPVGDALDHEKFTLIQPPLEYHRATGMLGDIQRLDIDKVRIYRRHRFKMDAPVKDMGVLLASGEGEPLAVEYPHGRGRIFIQTFPLDMSWSNLPVCRAFVVMSHEWLWYLSEPSQNQWNLNPGEALNVHLAEDYAAEASVVTPSQRHVDVHSIAEEGGRGYRFSGTLDPGPYQLVLEDGEGVTQIHPFQVRRLAGESDLALLSQESADAIGKMSGIQFTGDPSTPLDTTNAPPRYQPVWGWLLAALLAFLLIEALLAGLLTRRRQVGMPLPVARPNPLVLAPEAPRPVRLQPSVPPAKGNGSGHATDGQAARSKSDIAAGLFHESRRDR